MANLLSGIFELARGIDETEEWLKIFEESMPGYGWTPDDVIIGHSALFTIVLIPIVAIWFFASKTARVLITAFSLLTFGLAVPTILIDPTVAALDWLDQVYTLAMLGTVTLLFVPSANAWFNKEVQIDPAVFN